MPAVTVENPLTLPRLPEPAAGTPGRKVLAVETAPSGFEGEGFPVRRAPAAIKPEYLDPFVMMTRWARSTTRRASPRGRPGIRTAASRPSRT